MLTLNDSHAADGFTDNLPGKHKLGMRTRYQSVNDTWLGNAEAYTTRLKLTSSFNLDEDQQWQLLLEPNLVHAFNRGDYNSVTVWKRTAPIPDPHTFDISKAFLTYKSNNDWQIKLGRQMLAFDNERFVGNMEFWQKPQSFDALSIQYNDHINWNIQYAYTNKVHRIFGRKSTSTIPENDDRFGRITQRPANELGEHALNTHLLNVEYKTENNLSLVGYHYAIENKTQSSFSVQTTGIKISDEFKPAKIKYRYSAEFAHQNDFANNPNSYQVWYNLIEASAQYKSHQIQISQEILSTDQDYVFLTPLGTNHKFQGWVDIFSSYGIQTGLRDQYLTYKGRIKKLRWRGVYHRFIDYNTSKVIGNELDIELAYRASRKWEFKLIYAHYKADNGLPLFPVSNHNITTWFASVAYNI